MPTKFISYITLHKCEIKERAGDPLDDFPYPNWPRNGSYKYWQMTAMCMAAPSVEFAYLQ
jgi:hypothetical protein